jgi:TatD DNase family protein
MIDSHCHLAGEEFAVDLAAVVERAREAGLRSALCVLGAGDAAEAARARTVREVWPAVRFSIGIHPHHAADVEGGVAAAVAALRGELVRERACAIGEIGLDYHYEFSPRDVQQEVFRAQVRLARQLGLPVIVHTREATEDTFGILRDEGGAELRGVFHCFTGDAAMARAALDIGFHLSFAGIVTFPRAASLREAAKLVPADRLLAETDSPYLAPVPYRGTRNEPAYVTRVLDALAESRAEARAELAEATTRTFHELFGA